MDDEHARDARMLSMPMRTIRPRHLLGPLFILVTLVSLGCKDKQSPEDRVRAAIAAGVAAIEANDMSAIDDLIHDDYGDPAGRDKRKLKAMAFVMLRRGPVHLLVRDIQIKIDGHLAHTSFIAFALQGKENPESIKELLPQRGDKLEVEATFQDDGDGYQLKTLAGDGLRGGM